MPSPTIWGFFLLAAALFASTAAIVQHSTPRGDLRKRSPSPGSQPIPSPPFLPVFDSEQRQYLHAHNRLRRKVNVSALAWSPILTASAHAWAQLRREDCDYRHHSSNPYGENIFWMSYHEFSPADAVKWWFRESVLYDHTRMACMCHPERDGCECGHYLNVVWSTTRRVGCSGAVYCDDQKGVYVVCNYDPPGLIPGVNPFNGAMLSGY